MSKTLAKLDIKCLSERWISKAWKNAKEASTQCKLKQYWPRFKNGIEDVGPIHQTHVGYLHQQMTVHLYKESNMINIRRGVWQATAGFAQCLLFGTVYTCLVCPYSNVSTFKFRLRNEHYLFMITLQNLRFIFIRIVM